MKAAGCASARQPDPAELCLDPDVDVRTARGPARCQVEARARTGMGGASGRGGDRAGGALQRAA
ncbi:MAG: hypothetical protein ACRDYY_17840, partial [Acidimicrobiales bacterium]